MPSFPGTSGGHQTLNQAQPGMAAFTANLANVKQARPRWPR